MNQKEIKKSKNFNIRSADPSELIWTKSGSKVLCRSGRHAGRDSGNDFRFPDIALYSGLLVG